MPERSTPGTHRDAAARRKRTRRLLWIIPALVVIGVAPWVISFLVHSHSDTTAAPTNDPASILASAHASEQASRAAQTGGHPSSTAPGTSSSSSSSQSGSGPNQNDLNNVNKILAGSAVSDIPVSAADAAAVDTRPGPYQALGRLQIPKLNLDVTYGEGVSASTLEKGPGHWPGTSMPGQPGNSVISGHRNTHTQPFKYINTLTPGDKIIVSYGKSNPVTYKVYKTTIVPQAQYKDFVLRQPSDPSERDITLFACHPEGNPIYRIVVQARADNS